jgi:HEAT repeat protein
MTGTNDNELMTMVLDYMEKGFLDNIVDMFRRDESLFPFIVPMIQDERVRVRLGATALVEELSVTHRESLGRLIPELGGLLADPNPTVRGDCANLLGIIRQPEALPFLRQLKADDNESVREIAGEAIAEIAAVTQ